MKDEIKCTQIATAIAAELGSGWTVKGTPEGAPSDHYAEIIGPGDQKLSLSSAIAERGKVSIGAVAPSDDVLGHGRGATGWRQANRTHVMAIPVVMETERPADVRRRLLVPLQAVLPKWNDRRQMLHERMEKLVAAEALLIARAEHLFCHVRGTALGNVRPILTLKEGLSIEVGRGLDDELRPTVKMTLDDLTLDEAVAILDTLLELRPAKPASDPRDEDYQPPAAGET